MQVKQNLFDDSFVFTPELADQSVKLMQLETRKFIGQKPVYGGHNDPINH